MRFSTIAFTLFGAAASASASSLLARQATLPACATTCIENANLGGCVETDTHCLCTSQAFVASTTSCIESSCSGSDLQAALAAAQGLCAAVGVTLTAASSSTTAPSTSGSSSAPATTATTPTTSGSAAGTSPTAKSSASSHGVNALFGIVAAGLVAISL